MESDAQVLICAHATLRNAYDKIGAEPFANCLLAVDEFHHASADADSFDVIFSLCIVGLALCTRVLDNGLFGYQGLDAFLRVLAASGHV